MPYFNSTPEEGSKIIKAIVIRKRWLDLILDGAKTWEMRGKPAHYRGPLALICKGSGGQVLGLADLVDSLPRLSEAAFKASRDRHGVPPEEDARVLAAGWVFPWVLENVRQLPTPVLSGQKPGQVTWVPITETAAAEISRRARPLADRRPV